jgi:hypothetical protein
MMKKAGLDFGQEWSGIDPETIESDLRGRAIDGSGVRVKGKIMGARAFRKIGLWEEEHMAAWDDVPSNFSKYYKEPPRFLLMMALHVELGEDRDELAEMLGIRADPEATRKHPRKDKSEDKRRRKKT